MNKHNDYSKILYLFIAMLGMVVLPLLLLVCAVYTFKFIGYTLSSLNM
jgi:hypothetical protein